MKNWLKKHKKRLEGIFVIIIVLGCVALPVLGIIEIKFKLEDLDLVGKWIIVMAVLLLFHFYYYRSVCKEMFFELLDIKPKNKGG